MLLAQRNRCCVFCILVHIWVLFGSLSWLVGKSTMFMVPQERCWIDLMWFFKPAVLDYYLCIFLRRQDVLPITLAGKTPQHSHQSPHTYWRTLDVLMRRCILYQKPPWQNLDILTNSWQLLFCHINPRPPNTLWQRVWTLQTCPEGRHLWIPNTFSASLFKNWAPSL